MRPTAPGGPRTARSLRASVQRAFLAVSLATVVVAAPAGPGHAQVLPPGFTDELFASGLNVPTAFVFAPDGRIFVAEQGGTVRVVENGQVLGQPALGLAVETFREQGLLGIALDPAFPQQPYAYLLYTPYTGQETDNVHWVSRFTVDGDEFDPESEVVLMNDIPTGIGFHVAGCLRFGIDGNLFISTGDTNWGPPWPQELTRLEGKLLRIAPDGTIPADNPFVGVAGARPEIYQYGLRNPFRFTVQPGTGIPFISDVGASDWEEINVGPPGANFGWPLHEGPEVEPDSTTMDPFIAYAHIQGSGSVIGSAFYTGTQFPTEFESNFFFFDHVFGRLTRVVLGPANAIASVDTTWLRTPSSGAGFGPVDMQMGPDGALYYNTFIPGQIRRIAYVGSGNRRPSAVASASTTNGYVPLAITFSSAGSFDADGDSLLYDWNFGDGAPHSTGANPTHVYLANGVFQAQLTLTDGNGGIATSPPITITVGNLGPVVTIATPVNSATFVDGEVITFGGFAEDPELGPLPPEALHWQVVLNHQTHVHPILLDYTGTSGTFVASLHNEEPEHIFYTLTAWAQDAVGLRTERSVRIYADHLQPNGTLDVIEVESTDRDAVSIANEVRTGGMNAGKPFDLVSNDSDQMSGALQFRIDLPPQAVILEASLVLHTASIQVPSATGEVEIHAYDVGDCPPFTDGPGDLATLFPLVSAAVPWPMPPPWPSGVDVVSPDVGVIVQKFLSRDDYVPGSHLGFVLTKGTIEPDATYSWNDHAAGGVPSRLRLRYTVTTPVPDPRAARLVLHANVPNPFNPTTRIEFETGRSQPVRLDVLDVHGRLLRVLQDGVLGAGQHARLWDGRTTSGARCASGVYVYRLTAGERNVSRRMVLVR